jgi:RimJ/RimL family protein N-acetyltransferase
VSFAGPPGESGIAEIGYSVIATFRNQGLATEMVIAMTHWAELQPCVSAVEALVDLDNLASSRVMEKSGFERVGFEEDPPLLHFRHQAMIRSKAQQQRSNCVAGHTKSDKAPDAA